MILCGPCRNDAEALASAVDDWHSLAGHALRGWAGVLQTLIMLAKAARRAYFLSALDDDALAHEVSDQEASWVRTPSSQLPSRKLEPTDLGVVVVGQARGMHPMTLA